MDRKNLLEQKSILKRPLILDGAMGSLLQQQGFPSDKNLWYSKLNIDNADTVKNVHKEYISAGTDIITTNTFRTNPTAVRRGAHDLTSEQLVASSVHLALEARNANYIIIAGSNPPAQDCYQVDRTITKYELDYNHKKHIELLWENKVDLIWNETHSHWDEIELICKFCSHNSLPYTMNIYFLDSLKILSGEPLSEVVEFAKSFNSTAIGFNCIKDSTFFKYIDANSLPDRFGFYFNCGAGNITDEIITCGIDPNDYIENVKPLLKYDPIYIGSCCGSSPAHTKKIKVYFDEVYRN